MRRRADHPAARRRAGRSTGWPERISALLAGALAGLAWQPTALWQLVFPALALFSWLVLRPLGPAAGPLPWRRGLALGWFFGLGLGLVSISWVAVIGWYVVPPLLCFMALWQGLVGLVVVAAGRLTGNPLLRAAVVACGWSLSEYGASRIPFGGFGWMRLAWTQVDSPLGDWFPLLGAGGVSWLVAFCSGLLLALAAPAVRRATRIAAGVLVLVLALAGVLSARAIESGPQTGSVNVGMVQGNVDGSAGPHAMGYARSVTQNHVSETVTLMARARTGVDPMPDFVLWPENSTDIDPTIDAQTRQQFAITRARAMEMRREIVVSTTNSLSGLVHPDGTVTGLTDEGTAASQTFTVPTRIGTTPALWVGPAVELLASLVAAAALLLAAGRGAARASRGTG